VTGGVDAAAAEAGVGSDADGGTAASAPRSVGARTAVLVAASVALVAVVVVAFSIGRLSTLASPTPTDASADAGFARDMQVHHQQGVELAMIVRDATADPDVRLLAYDIALTQAQQSGQMYGWLNEWGLSQAGSEPSMTWMSLPAVDGGGGATGHDGHSGDGGAAGAAHAPGGPMPGLATAEQVAELRAATGVEAERRFLELMIAHHEGAVEMADAALARASSDVVLRLARTIVESQTAEIAIMREMLAERE
jgi:uncharacterized protein (DUF305 family)